ncbi:DNRLRE domain-containing protein, partial [Schleiferiaceae bacterium]|nr:DNRLRE domain-containing protein [Schleiferiaceae bacterium]
MGRLYFLFFLLSSSIVLAQTQDSLVLQPGPLDGKDAIVWSITPDSTWGWNQEATMTAWTYQGDPSYKRFYIEFDYSNIPAGAIIDSAFIFYNNNPSAPSHSGLHSGSNTFWVRRVTSSWDEDSITWNNAPSATTTNQVQVGASSSNTMDYKIDVKNLVED